MKKVSIVLGMSVLLFACQKQHGNMSNEMMSSNDNQAAMMNGTGRPLTANLTGAQEVPGPGDPDGTGIAIIRINQGQGTIYYELMVSNIEPAAAAHIHRGVFGMAGGVVVHLAAPTNGTSSGTATASAELIKEISQYPERFYVNVHNAPFPGGAVRGQLSK